jgi:ADP-ribose pyrophosphatase YjhB (NUDIX family)/chloramphenicol 3-O-phosphotransferase
MPTITVSALITDGERLLLARRPGEPHWALPGGLLLPADETVEDALARELRERLGVEVGEPLFLDTLYERRAQEVVVHNVFAVTAPGIEQAVARGGRELEYAWAPLAEIERLPLVPWLAPALPVLLQGEPAPEPDLTGVPFAVVPPVEPGVEPGTVMIVTGPAGAGKTTVARELCRRFERAAHIAVDKLRHMVVSGYASPLPGQADAEEARRQGQLARRNAAALARNFAGAGFHAVIDDVLERREELDEYLAALAGCTVACVTLLPTVEALHARDAGRPPEQRMGDRALALHRTIAANGETRGLRLDTSGWTPEQTVDVILERLPEALVAVGWQA